MNRRNRLIRYVLTVLLAFGLILAGGCLKRRETDSSFSTSRLRGKAEVGMASYYGKEWHGEATASGEKFDMNALTAAHKELPFGTVVKVTNLANGKSVKVRINDRGPYVEGRIIDLSYAAAKKIGMLADGVVRVKVEVVD